MIDDFNLLVSIAYDLLKALLPPVPQQEDNLLHEITSGTPAMPSLAP